MGKAYKLTSAKTAASRLFVKFIRGLESRIERLIVPNVGLDHSILIKICEGFDKELGDSTVP